MWKFSNRVPVGNRSEGEEKGEQLLLCNGTILTFDEDNPFLERGSILIEGDKISRIGKPEDFRDYKGESFELYGKVIMPGLINAHHHFYSTLVRGLTKSKPAADFNEVLQNLWWRLDSKLQKDDIYYSTLYSIYEAIRKGTTTIIDHHASPGAVRGSLNIIARAVEECGIRACLCYEVSDRDGKKVAASGLAENVNWLQRVERENNPYLRGLFGMHAAFTLEDETLQEIAEAGSDTGCGYHLHVAEAEYDENHSIRHYNKRVVERLADFGLLNDKTIAAHGVYLNEREMEILAEKGVAVIHNPQSNLNNAVGIANICRMAEKGIIVGLGTDAMTNDMLEEARVALWAQHWRQKDPAAGFGEVINALTVNNPEIANRYWGGILGKLKEGYAADIIALDYSPPTPLGTDNWPGHLIFGISQAQVDTTIINGRVLLWNKQLYLDIDEELLAARSREVAKKLWDRF